MGIPFGTDVSSAAWEIALDASNAKIQTWTSHKKERFTVCNNFLISDKKKSLADNMEETIQGVQSY